jgi:hypothetical protein
MFAVPAHTCRRPFGSPTTRRLLPLAPKGKDRLDLRAPSFSHEYKDGHHPSHGSNARDSHAVHLFNLFWLNSLSLEHASSCQRGQTFCNVSVCCVASDPWMTALHVVAVIKRSFALKKAGHPRDICTFHHRYFTLHPIVSWTFAPGCARVR